MTSCFKDPTFVLMRALLCSLRLENTPHVSSTASVSSNDDLDDAHDDVDNVDGHGNDEVREESRVDGKEEEGRGTGNFLKSSLRKADSGSIEAEKREKKKVQWVDLMGKELAEIREFEPSDEEDICYDGGKSCVCVIM
ncbi:PREDICTED: uncharacterized protein LOC104810320 isoform X2 [Tarenaya hassleriana]|uniref:uncharacterized protein LOC104810320 isoform X2 n=1 Tax=Tarenaya hassleriana TaxID=28532 RepID=UPI00053C5236|nr:PREDICTED: uncharacterized protein LOC104810320 isoform X2 [Tarenaya hassleriana]